VNSSDRGERRQRRVPRTRVLYLLTDEISSVLVRGQLGYLVGEGFDVTVALAARPPASRPSRASGTTA
jgi:hypothetical protein